MSNTTVDDSALGALTRAYRSDVVAAPDGRAVIGFVGHDVPIELITAVGMIPLRLRGNPEWETSGADHYLGTGLDPATRALMAGILDNRFGDLAGIVVSSDCDASQRLFYALREIHRVEPQTLIPPVYLVDILHLPRESTTAYNELRIAQFIEVLERCAGVTLSDQVVQAAVDAHNEVRALQRQVMALRYENPARLGGSEALAVLGAGSRLTPESYAQLLRTLLEQRELLPERRGTRVFLSGSSHDSDHVYRAIEVSGALIVGEDHDWGALAIETDVEQASVRGLALRYQHNGPTSQRSTVRRRGEYTAMAAERAGAELVLSYSRERDEAPLWDVPAQRSATPLPVATALRQRYGQIDPQAVAEALDARRDEELAS